MYLYGSVTFMTPSLATFKYLPIWSFLDCYVMATFTCTLQLCRLQPTDDTLYRVILVNFNAIGMFQFNCIYVTLTSLIVYILTHKYIYIHIYGYILQNSLLCVNREATFLNFWDEHFVVVVHKYPVSLHCSLWLLAEKKPQPY